MKEFVAVKSLPNMFVTQLLKRDAIMFSRFAIPGCRKIQPGIAEEPLASELDWLLEQGLVFDPLTDNIEPLKKIISGFSQDAFTEQIREFRKIKPSHEFRDDILDGLKEYDLDADKDTLEFVDILFDSWLQGELLLRPISVLLREDRKIDAYPVFTLQMEELQENPADKADILCITLNALPMPDEGIAWESIFDYRNDLNSLSNFMALRNWMNEVARAKLTPLEVEQKLEYLIDQYQRHMKLHRMKTNAGTFEAVVVASAEFLEDLARFKWGKIAQSLFSLKHKRIALLEGELTAPGNEIAYIVKAREWFL